jgi:hypothetical protein
LESALNNGSADDGIARRLRDLAARFGPPTGTDGLIDLDTATDEELFELLDRS